jgi:hypothetical protein
MYALAALKGASPDEIEHVRQRKHAERGGFRGRLFLLEGEDERDANQMDWRLFHAK